MILANQFSPIKHQAHPHTSQVNDPKTYPLNINLDRYIFQYKDCGMPIQKIDSPET